jgi:hypothetical protein
MLAEVPPAQEASPLTVVAGPESTRPTAVGEAGELGANRGEAATTARARIPTDALSGRPTSSRMYVAIRTAFDAPLKPRETISSDHPATKPMVGPHAWRAYTYLPPASGSAAAISANTSVERPAMTPPKNHIARMIVGSPR